jgi:hypothetical protein
VANFNPADYETVDSRIKRFYGDHPEGRITTELVSTDRESGATRWVVRASVFRGTGYVEPDGTGYAFEIDGQAGANKTSALENCETSAIGRALANIGYSGDKRASREEMAKTQRPQDSQAFDTLVEEWTLALNDAGSLTELQDVWNRAGAAGVTADPRIIAAKDRQKAALK